MNTLDATLKVLEDEEMYSDEDVDDDDYAFPSETDDETRLRVAREQLARAAHVASRAAAPPPSFGGAP